MIYLYDISKYIYMCVPFPIIFHVNPMKIHKPSQVHGETSSGSPWLSLERTGAAAFRRLKGERLGIYHGLIQEYTQK